MYRSSCLTLVHSLLFLAHWDGFLLEGNEYAFQTVCRKRNLYLKRLKKEENDIHFLCKKPFFPMLLIIQTRDRMK